MNVFIVVLVLVWLASAGTAAFIASEKGRDGFVWFVSGILFGIFAMIAVAASPAIWEKPKSVPSDKATDEPSALHSGNTDQGHGTATDNKTRKLSPSLDIVFVFVIGGGMILLALVVLEMN